VITQLDTEVRSRSSLVLSGNGAQNRSSTVTVERPFLTEGSGLYCDTPGSSFPLRLQPLSWSPGTLEEQVVLNAGNGRE
jgi:hypothetical protein